MRLRHNNSHVGLTTFRSRSQTGRRKVHLYQQLATLWVYLWIQEMKMPNYSMSNNFSFVCLFVFFLYFFIAEWLTQTKWVSLWRARCCLGTTICSNLLCVYACVCLYNMWLCVKYSLSLHLLPKATVQQRKRPQSTAEAEIRPTKKRFIAMLLGEVTCQFTNHWTSISGVLIYKL